MQTSWLIRCARNADGVVWSRPLPGDAVTRHLNLGGGAAQLLSAVSRRPGAEARRWCDGGALCIQV